ARGDTWHLVVNALYVANRLLGTDTTTFTVEGITAGWTDVTQNPNSFLGRDAYTGLDKPTKNFFAASLSV
ncbi:MAG: hypothetical protein ACR2I0_06045, partial [Rhodoferax sp.]